MAKDLLIADLQDEIQGLQRKFQEQEEQQSKILASTEAKNRVLSEKVREVEKQSSILRSAILSGQLQPHPISAPPQTESTRALRIAAEKARSTELFEAGCSAGVVSCSKAGPDPRTLLLHRVLAASREPRRGFCRINPARSDADSDDALLAGPFASAATSLPAGPRSRPAAAGLPDSMPPPPGRSPAPHARDHSYSAVTGPSSGRSTPVPTAHAALGSLRGRPTPAADPPASSAAPPPPPPASGGGRPDGAGDGGAEWLETFHLLLESAEREGAATLSVQSEKKRRLRVRKEVLRLLLGGGGGAGTGSTAAAAAPAASGTGGGGGGGGGGGSFHDTVDALDRRTRADCLDEVARMFRLLGLLLRAAVSLQAMTAAGLDMTLVCEAIRAEARALLEAQQVRRPAGPRRMRPPTHDALMRCNINHLAS
jgi:hypothetical protein